MQRMKVTCGTCCGCGNEIRWKDIPLSNTMEREELVCGVCGGKGYAEYAVFSIEEAEEILRHCGLKEI